MDCDIVDTVSSKMNDFIFRLLVIPPRNHFIITTYRCSRNGIIFNANMCARAYLLSRERKKVDTPTLL